MEEAIKKINQEIANLEKESEIIEVSKQEIFLIKKEVKKEIDSIKAKNQYLLHKNLPSIIEQALPNIISKYDDERKELKALLIPKNFQKEIRDIVVRTLFYQDKGLISKHGQDIFADVDVDGLKEIHERRNTDLQISKILDEKIDEKVKEATDLSKIISYIDSEIDEKIRKLNITERAEEIIIENLLNKMDKIIESSIAHVDKKFASRVKKRLSQIINLKTSSMMEINQICRESIVNDEELIEKLNLEFKEEHQKIKIMECKKTGVE